MKIIYFIALIVILSSDLSGQIEHPNDKELDSLKTKLEIIFMKDQTFRRIYIEAEAKLGKDSDEMEYFWEVVEAQDKVLRRR